MAEEKAEHPLVVLRRDLEARTDEFQAALPAHIPVERFRRVILTAVQRNPTLVNADRRSFWNAAMQSAQDGLLPDGREGAMVIYRTKGKDGNWTDAVQWLPMVFGIQKKVRNSGEISSITARVVYGGDTYRYWIDDTGEHIHYEPAENPDTNTLRCVFATARTHKGEIFIEVMTPAEIEKVRSISRAKDKGPWVDWFEEMAKKTAIRRLAKRLPMSSDLDDLIRRDDNLYDLSAPSDAQVKGPRASLGASLDRLAELNEPAAQIAQTGPTIDLEADAETGEIVEAPAPKGDAASLDAEGIAYDRGFQARKKGMSQKAMPPEYRAEDRVNEANSWRSGWDAGASDNADA